MIIYSNNQFMTDKIEMKCIVNVSILKHLIIWKRGNDKNQVRTKHNPVVKSRSNRSLETKRSCVVHELAIIRNN